MRCWRRGLFRRHRTAHDALFGSTVHIPVFLKVLPSAFGYVVVAVASQQVRVTLGVAAQLGRETQSMKLRVQVSRYRALGLTAARMQVITQPRERQQWVALNNVDVRVAELLASDHLSP